MHPEVLRLKQRKIFSKLRNFPDFCLGGGTALALQMGHRASIDFDLFSKKDIPAGLIEKAEMIFKDFKVDIIINHSEQLSLMIGNTKVDFLKYPFPLLSNYVEFEGVCVLKVSEIAVMKAYAMGRRATLKDYVDLYFIMKRKYISLEEIIKSASAKYKQKFDPRLFLEQLIYLEDVEDMKILFLKEKVNRFQIQKFFEKRISEFKNAA